jgi:hypothetical protein
MLPTVVTIDTHTPPAIYQSYDISSEDGLQDALRRANIEAAARVRQSADEIRSLSDLTTRYTDPSADLAKKQDSVARQHLKAFNAAKARISDLKVDARAEGHQVSAASESDLWAFLNTKVFIHRPYITLLDNGNLRALWKNSEGEQIGLQFRGSKEVQYVLFARRQNGDFIARASGRDTLANIGRQIDAHELRRLMAE